MNSSGANALNQTGPLSYILGTGALQQVLLSFVMCVLLYILLLALEMVYKSYKQVTGVRVPLLPLTVSADDKPREFEQNPNKLRTLEMKQRFMPLSDNERSGAEFTYSFWLWVNPSSFKQEQGLLHIMHKGHPTPYPLLGPGVFLHSNINTLRVYMNSSKTWNNYVDIENLPVKKWVYITIVARDNHLEIYINGNLAKKLNVDGAVLYQNFGNLYLFNQRPCNLNPTLIPSLRGQSIMINGTYSGNLSNLYYFSYALSYTEIQALLDEGPSQKAETNVMDQPPYLKDNWWVSGYSR